MFGITISFYWNTKNNKRNYQEFYRRGKALQVLGVGFWEKGRMPTLDEVKEHIDLETTAPKMEARKWKTVIRSVVEDKTNNLIELEKSEDKSLNEHGYNFS